MRIVGGSHGGDGMIDTSATDNPGQIDITAGGAVVILGRVQADASATDGSGGIINVLPTANATVYVIDTVLMP